MKYRQGTYTGKVVDINNGDPKYDGNQANVSRLGSKQDTLAARLLQPHQLMH